MIVAARLAHARPAGLARALLLVFLASMPARVLLGDAGHRVTGTVRDASGAAVRDATVSVETVAGTVAGVAKTDDAGEFAVARVAAGRYVVRVHAPGFAERTLAIDVRGDTSLAVGMDLAPIAERVTVTASLDDPARTSDAAQPVNVIGASQILERSVTVVAQAAAEEAGLALQRTSPSISGVYVRGLTGNKVNVFVDGVRYSTGAQRGGINTFLNLIEATSLDTIEVLRGPGSAQYGSDALGGSLQFLTVAPTLGTTARGRVGGSAGVGLGTADASAGANLLLSYSAPRFGAIASAAGRHVGRLRAGHGIDSHAAVTRFLGLRSDVLMDARLPDTGFDQYDGLLRGRWALRPGTQVNVSYAHSRQDGGRRYDQLLGGDGNLVADLRGLRLDFFYARVEQLGVAGFDTLSATVSINRQREERVNQGGNGNPRAAIAFEPERVLARGMQVQATRSPTAWGTVTFGADGYFEGLASPSTALDPITGARTPRRPRVPDGATFANGGAFAQVTAAPRPWLQLVANLRYGVVAYDADASDSELVNGGRLWPDDHLSDASWTYRASAVTRVSDRWTALVSVSSGYRAPHMTDLGTLGLTGSGFEVAFPDVAGRGATVGSTANAQAVSTGIGVEQVSAEKSLNLDAGLRYRSPRLRADLSVFANRIDGNLEKYALVLPPGAVGTALGTEEITSQLPNGVVFVAASSGPVLVRANVGDALVRGAEQSIEWRASDTVTLSTVGTWIHAEDRATGAAPNIEGGTPAPEVYAFARYTARSGRWWVQPWLRAVARTTRLSTLDLEDRRTGATRTRSTIQAFFRNGATARGWVSAGPDGRWGTADDLLSASGETLREVQERVLGAGVASSALFPELPGFAVFGARGGLRLGAHEIVVSADNIADRSYRGISWGLDGPGRSLALRYLLRF